MEPIIGIFCDIVEILWVNKCELIHCFLYFQIVEDSFTLDEAASLCYQQGVNWSLPVIQTEEAHQSLVRFMMEHNISSAWLGWRSVPLKNWTWVNGEICKYYYMIIVTKIYTSQWHNMLS